MRKYRGIIKNEENKVIFSRAGKFENAEQCLETLYQVVNVDVPDQHSLVYNILYGGEFEDSHHCLRRYYTDKSKLSFKVIEII